MKVKKLNRSTSIDVKRFYLPAIIKGKCPKCGTPTEIDLESDYLSYPILNEFECRHLYCSECEHEQEIEIKIEMTLSVKGQNIVIA